MSMHPVNFPKFMGFKQKFRKLQEIYMIDTHVR